MRLLKRWPIYHVLAVVLIVHASTAVGQVETRNEDYLTFGSAITYAKLTGGNNFYFHTGQHNFKFDELGDGFGPAFSVGVHVPFSDRLGLVVQFELNQLLSSRTEPFGDAMTHSYTKQWDYLGGAAMLRFNFTRRFYILGGAGIYSLVADNFDASEYSSANPSAPITNYQDLVSNGLYNPLRIDLKIGLGAEIPILDNFILSPQILLHIPVTNLYTPGAIADYAANNATPPNLNIITAALEMHLPFSVSSGEAPVIDTERQPVALIPATVTGPRVVPNVNAVQPQRLLASPMVLHFAFDSSRVEQLLPSDSARLREVAMELSAIPNKRLVIEGHADNIGSEAYNTRLSHERAVEVERYLVSLGVPAARLSVVAFGASRPVATNDTESGRAENRRVVLRLLE